MDNNTTESVILRMAEVDHAQAVEYILALCLIAIFLPLVPHRKIRYFGCYICYVMAVSVASIVFIPFFAFRPRNIANLKIAAKVLRPFTKVLGISWELRNGEVLKKDRAAVITANHQTILDIMGMFNIWDVMDKCTVVAKKELLYIPPFGQAAWLAGLVYIDRVNPKAANAQLNTASTIIHSMQAKFWMFPEGTRNKKAIDLLPFKRGAFRVAIESQVPIIPIVYSPYYFIDSKHKTFDEGKVIISVLDSIPTKGMTIDDIDKLKDNTYRVMSQEWERLKKEVLIYRKE